MTRAAEEPGPTGPVAKVPACRGMRYPFPLLLAHRYLRSKRSDALISALSAMTAIGLALGVAALILALAVLSGFQRHLLDDVIARTPKLEVTLEHGQDAVSTRQRVAEIDGVESVQLLVWGSGWLVDGAEYRPVELVGFEDHLPQWFPRSAPSPAEGSGPGELPAAEGMYLSDVRRLAWGLVPGDDVRIVTPRPMLTPLGRPMPTRREVPLAGSYDAGRSEPEVERVAVPLEIAKTLVGDGDRRLDVELAPGVDEATLAATIGRVTGAEVRTWRDVNRALLFILRLEKSLVFVAVFLIVVVASLALVAALALIQSSKQWEFGVLAALGATPRALRRSFLLLGMELGVIGALVGALVGIGTALLLDRYRVIDLPAGIYIVDHLPFLVRVSDVATVLGCTLVLSWLASRWAARTVATLDPVEAMRS